MKFLFYHTLSNLSINYLFYRTTVFDENIHKYGEITIKNKRGSTTLLSEELVKSGFALYDTCLFHQELSMGNLKTKLNRSQLSEVMKQLEQPVNKKPKEQWQKSVKSQTTIYHTGQKLESSLTVENLVRHNKNVDVYDILDKKLKDLECCKDADEVSVGRASKHKVLSSNNEMLARSQPIINKSRPEILPLTDPYQTTLMATKNFLEAHATIKSNNTFTSDDVPEESIDSSLIEKSFRGMCNNTISMFI